ncbi:MAG: DUF1214 domain-containing protein [Syntrophobacteraceae bacterium]
MDCYCPTGCGIFSGCREVKLKLRLRVSGARGDIETKHVREPAGRYPLLLRGYRRHGAAPEWEQPICHNVSQGQIPPVNGFWALTMYDKYHFFVPNPIKRYLLRTKNKKLKPKPGRLPDGLLSERVDGRGQGVEQAAGSAGELSKQL